MTGPKAVGDIREFWEHSGDHHPDSILSTLDVQRVRDFVNAGIGDEATEDTWKPLCKKMASDPRHGDCGLLLSTTHSRALAMMTAYNAKVHALTRVLLVPLKSLIHDVDDKKRDVLEPAIKGIGEGINSEGGFASMIAAHYVACALLADEASFTNTGEPWSNAYDSLNIAWNGVGKWKC